MSVADAAAELGVAPNTVSTLVRQLAYAGVLERAGTPPTAGSSGSGSPWTPGAGSSPGATGVRRSPPRPGRARSGRPGGAAAGAARAGHVAGALDREEVPA